MGPTTRPSNRGPAAAAENRRALLRAARELFAEHGYAVPLSAIARSAGVGQGVLYRHFPRRVDLAFAVFEENFAELEALAAAPDPAAFDRFFARIVEMLLDSVGFIELVVGARGVDYDGGHRFLALLTPPLGRAQEAGSIAPHVTPGDVELALRMIYGVAVTARDDAQRRTAVAHAQSVVTAHWRP